MVAAQVVAAQNMIFCQFEPLSKTYKYLRFRGILVQFMMINLQNICIFVSLKRLDEDWFTSSKYWHLELSRTLKVLVVVFLW